MKLGRSSCRLLIVVALSLSFSAAICRAEHCPYQYPGNEPTITSITPTTWHAGQTIQITITGNFPGGDQPGCEMNEGDAVGQTSDPWNFFDGVGIYPGVTIELDPNDPNFDAGTFTPTQVTLTVQIAANAPSGTAYIGLECDGCDGYSVGGPVQIIGQAKNIGNPCSLPGSDGVGRSHQCLFRRCI